MVSSTPPTSKADQSGLDTEVGAELPPIPFPQFKERLLELHSSLAELPSLDPSEETNQLFAALVTLVSTSYANTAALARECALDSEIQGIQPDLIRICAEADGKQELWWARKISSGSSADSRYLFPYYQNYIQLTRLEYHVLVGLGADPRHVGFVGSGPLPLSSSILAADYILPRWNCLESSSPSYSSRSPSLSKQDLLQNSSLDPSVPTWKVTNVDILPDANAAAQAFCTTAFPLLISSGNCHFLTSSALDLPPPLLASFDTIYIAALVGLSPATKLRVVTHIANHMRLGAYLVVRSAHRLRSLMYPQIDEDALLDAGRGRLAIQAVLHPKNVVNSVLVARRI